MKYKIEITETLQRVIEVKARNLSEAIKTVCDMYDKEQIVLNADDFTQIDIREYGG